MAKQKKDRPAITPEILKSRLFLRVQEYAALTGTPTATAYSLIAAGKIPGVTRIGNSLRIPVRVVLDQLAAGDAA